ncbi:MULTISPECIES: hypothetical protein [Clostridium]|uniref:hypothetical protein n=1 Tax=Clostridium TaxID=1485 RepID=UPI0012E5513F|nr:MULTISPECIES: hypothetical protein [Clostridium]MBS4780786.1 hypothetical protein [Clostridium sp.]CAI3628958.1 conserved hypothetical protein [Clostridium neonatale]SUQ53172.1 hypothetical protein CNEONATNEC86_03436 [Clostridium neonatale]
MSENEILKSVNDYLYNLKEGIKSVSELIQSGKEYEAVNLIVKVSDGLEWINEALNCTKDYNLNNLNLNEINGFIGEICEALENEDFILVSDLFNYEIIPILEKLHDSIRKCV